MNKRLSIGQKLLLMLVAPLLGLIFFAMNGIMDKQRVVSEMQEIAALVDFSQVVGELVHELQRERGLSAGFVASDGQEFSVELPAQRSETDTALSEFRNFVTEHAASVQVLGSLEAARSNLNALDNRREGISGGAATVQDATQYYTGVIEVLLTLVQESSQNVTNASVMEGMLAYWAFLQYKERAGIERAVLNEAFARNGFADEAHQAQFLQNLGGQQSFEFLFAQYATQTQREAMSSRLRGSAVEQFEQFRNIALDQAHRGNFGVEPGRWFQVSTARIDLLMELEQQYAQDTVGLADTLRSEAQRALYAFSILALVAFILALGLAQYVGRTISGPLTNASEAAREIAHQIVATTQQQGSTASETATAVEQTTSTVGEIRQTSEIAAERAQTVTDKAGKSVTASNEALVAIEDGVEAMSRIREEVEGIARNILELSEKHIQIGEIVQSVNAIAEQSNLLAVNASIEAAKAGEHGKGFSVVAGEVKALAGQSKEATQQIRTILGEIQKSSNAAVMVTEQGTKRVEEGSSLVEELGQTIRELGQVIEESMDAATQIAATSNQQLTGIEQITSAMTNIEQATKDNASGIGQLEAAAKQVREVSEQLVEVVLGKREGV